MDISFITHDKILTVAKVRGVQADSRSDGVSTVVSGDLNVIRARSISASARMLYKGREVQRISSWCALDPAIEDARRVADLYEINEESEAEIIVLVTVEDVSSVAMKPDQFDCRSIRVASRHQMEFALRAIPDHQTVKHMDAAIVWSTKKPTKMVDPMSMAKSLMDEGRFPRECLEEVKEMFVEG